MPRGCRGPASEEESRILAHVEQPLHSPELLNRQKVRTGRRAKRNGGCHTLEAGWGWS